MPIENLNDRNRYLPTQPYDVNDLPRFGQLVETAKDAFAWELQNFFSYKTTDASSKIIEIPTIQKFALGATSSENSLETVVDLIMSYGDTLDKYPMIAITGMNLREKKMSIGDNYTCNVQYPPSIVGANAGPFNLDYGTGEAWYLEIITYPLGDSESRTVSTIVFDKILFVDYTNVSTVELVEAINKSQALYYTCSVSTGNRLRISAGGPCAQGSPNYIEITDGSLALLNLLGFSVGDSDDYLSTANPSKNRYEVFGDMTINVDVVSDSLNTKTELADLVFSFFAFYMEKRRFQFLGRSYFDRDLDPTEWYHIILKNQFAWSGETTRPRQGGEQYEHIYAIRGSIPIFIEDFIDRDIVTEPRFLLSENVQSTDLIPNGDYFGDDFTRGRS